MEGAAFRTTVARQAVLLGTISVGTYIGASQIGESHDLCVLPVCRRSSSAILVMKAAEIGPSSDATDALDGSIERHGFAEWVVDHLCAGGREVTRVPTAKWVTLLKSILLHLPTSAHGTSHDRRQRLEFTVGIGGAANLDQPGFPPRSAGQDRVETCG
jgi:hypothetical protein